MKQWLAYSWQVGRAPGQSVVRKKLKTGTPPLILRMISERDGRRALDERVERELHDERLSEQELYDWEQEERF